MENRDVSKALFMDIEWNQRRRNVNSLKDEIIEIGFSWYEGDQIRQLFRVIKPETIEKVSSKTLNVTRMQKQSLLDAASYEEVMKTLRLPQFEYLVLWSRDAYQLFCAQNKAHKVAFPKHKVVILQEEIQSIFESKLKGNSFENMLIYFGICYRSDLLHCAKHDAKYLLLLYEKILEKCEGKEVNSNLICQEELMKIVEVKSNIKKNGYSKENVLALLEIYHLLGGVQDSYINIVTKYSYWIVYYDCKQVIKVYHSNYDKDIYGKMGQGYHNQNINTNDLGDVIRYILCHDDYITWTLKKKEKKVINRGKGWDHQKKIDLQKRESRKQRKKFDCLEGY